MAKVLYVEDAITPDQLGTSIANKWTQWDRDRANKRDEWTELHKFLFATDTRYTTARSLPWSNKTTLPKLCQIRDNLTANYLAALFPKKKWLRWEPSSPESQNVEKAELMEGYARTVSERNEFRSVMRLLVDDYVSYGNCFAMVDWVDGRNEVLGEMPQHGYVGPAVKRISPLDIVFDPTAPSFSQSPKIIKSMVSRGEVKELLERLSNETETREAYEELWKYLSTTREHFSTYEGSVQHKDDIYEMSGFTSFREYMESDVCEILTFYGDIYDEHKGEFLRNHKIIVVDRHKVIWNGQNPSWFGAGHIWHCGWRSRPDNLWAMGPLDNLVGMQHRIDHLENMKADLWDLTRLPPLKIKGYVEDFTWGPMERIYVGDDGDVEMIAPNVAALEADQEIAFLQQQMEEMAGSPKETMGFRSPGEKTKYEVQRLETAASRIFQAKIMHFEEELLENVMNGMVEFGRRMMTEQVIKMFDDELKFNTFVSITPEDLSGEGAIKPFAARHFAEQANIVQNMNQFFASPAYQVVAPHVSTVKAAQMWEDLLEVQDYGLFTPYIAIQEQADAQRQQQVEGENVFMEGQSPMGLTEDDLE